MKKLLMVAAVLLIAWPAKIWADGPHWYIPEPPEDDYQLIDFEPATIERYRNAMKFGPSKDKERVLNTICEICIRYLREYESYVAAPDSPEPWHSQEGREKMAEYALEALRILGERSAPMVVQALADQMRFMDDIRAGKISDRMKKFVEINNKLNELLQKMMEGVDDVNKVPKDKLQAWRTLAKGELIKVMADVQTELPRTFVKNMTGDIPFLQDDADSRMIEAVRRIGWQTVPHLQKLLQDRSVRVARQAAELLRMMNALRANPPPLTADPDSVAAELRKIKSNSRNPRSPEATGALQRLQKAGKDIWPILIQIAKDEKYGLKREAVGTLQYLTRQAFGEDLAKWEKYVLEQVPGQVKAPEPAPIPEAQPAPQIQAPEDKRGAAPDDFLKE